MTSPKKELSIWIKRVILASGFCIALGLFILPLVLVALAQPKELPQLPKIKDVEAFLPVVKNVDGSVEESFVVSASAQSKNTSQNPNEQKLIQYVNLALGVTDTSPKKLDVPYYYQGSSAWCAYTSLAMLLKYYGQDTKPWVVAGHFNASPDEGASGAVIKDLFSNGFISYIQELSLDGDSSVFILPSSLEQYLKDQVSNYNRPVLLALYTPAHVVVVTGWDNDHIYINDPSGALFEKLYDLYGKPEYYPSPLISQGVDWVDFRSFLSTYQPWMTTLIITSSIPGTPKTATISTGQSDSKFWFEKDFPDYSVSMFKWDGRYINGYYYNDFYGRYTDDESLGNIMTVADSISHLNPEISNGSSSTQDINLTWEIRETYTNSLLYTGTYQLPPIDPKSKTNFSIFSDDYDIQTQFPMSKLGAGSYKLIVKIKNITSQDEIGLYFKVEKIPNNYSVTNISPSNPSPSDGETISVSAKVTNSGFADETNVPVKFYVDDVEQATQNISLVSGSSTEVSFNWIAQSGSHNLKVQSYLSTDENPPDDFDSLLINVGPAAPLPDLTGSIRISPDPPLANRECVITRTFKNNSSTASGPFHISAMVDYHGQSMNFPDGLAGNAEFSLDFTFPQCPDYTFGTYLKIDDQNQVIESDENNNYISESFTPIGKNISVCQSGTCDYTTIQEGINAAYPKDTIQIADRNSYHESVTFPEKDNITLDCAGGTIDATGLDYGITLNGNNNAVKNCTIKNAGIFGILINNHIVSGSTWVSPANNTISGNTITNNSQGGIEIDGKGGPIKNHNIVGNSISNNGILGPYAGIHLLYAESIRIESNTISSQGTYGINLDLSSLNNTIIYNEIKSNGTGIFIQDPSTGNDISYNNIYGNYRNLSNRQTANITAKNNWWGTRVKADIDAKIEDGNDNPSYGLLDYEPYLCNSMPDTTASPCPADTTPPSPNPMTWYTEPSAIDANNITMTANVAFDEESPPVQYYFTFTHSPDGGTGGNSSDWQSSTQYTDNGLQDNKTYCYSVKAQDSASTPNETLPSDPEVCVRTPAIPDTTPPNPSPMTWKTVPYAVDSQAVSMEATTATDTDSPPVQYRFNDLAWQDSPIYMASGLAPNTEYCYTVKARDSAAAANVTQASEQKCATTPSEPVPNQPPVIDTIVDQTVNEGATLNIPLRATDPNAGDHITLSFENLPTFCQIHDQTNLNPATAEISCSPNFRSGSTNKDNLDKTFSDLTVKAVDNGSSALSASPVSFALTVMNVSIFVDIYSGFWAYGYIEALYNANLVSGYGAEYRPVIVVDRAQMAVFIARAIAGSDDNIPAGPSEPTFSDVPTDFWAYKHIEYLVAEGIVKGYPDGTYQPALGVTRDQMAVFIARAYAGGDQNVPAGPSEPTFPDVPTDFWAYKYIEYLASEDIVQGYLSGTYGPTIPVSRDQMAVFIYRAFLEN